MLARGVTDMVRISDGRMSGTGFGTVVLHVSPEAAAGGVLAFVQTGDTITLDVAARSLEVDVVMDVMIHDLEMEKLVSGEKSRAEVVAVLFAHRAARKKF